MFRESLKRGLVNGYQFSWLSRGFCFSSSSLYFFAIGHLYNVSSTTKDPLGLDIFLFPLLTSCFITLPLSNLSLSLSLSLQASRHWVRNFFSDMTINSERLLHSRVWFFGFSEDNSDRHYTKINESCEREFLPSMYSCPRLNKSVSSSKNPFRSISLSSNLELWFFFLNLKKQRNRIN